MGRKKKTDTEKTDLQIEDKKSDPAGYTGPGDQGGDLEGIPAGSDKKSKKTAAPKRRGPETHELKTDSKYFAAVWTGDKRFEVRKNDRDFRPGDFVWLDERRGSKSTGRRVWCKILYILNDREYCPKGMIIFSMKVLQKINKSRAV